MPENQKVPRIGWKMDAVVASYSLSSSSITSPAEDIGASRETLIRRYFEEGFEYRIHACHGYYQRVDVGWRRHAHSVRTLESRLSFLALAF